MSDFRHNDVLLFNGQAQDQTEAWQQDSSTNQMEDRRLRDCKIIIEKAKNRKEQELQKRESPREARINLNLPEGSYAIQEHERNNPQHPGQESTNTMPILIRRIESAEILPTPFRTTTQLLVCTYLTCICCCLCGVFATKAAFKAKILRNKGLYVPAKKHARKALYWMLGAVISGLLICTIIGITVGLQFR